MNDDVDACLDTAPYHSFQCSGRNAPKACVQEFSRVDLGHRQLGLRDRNHGPIGAADKNTAKTALSFCRLHVMGSIGPRGWARKFFGPIIIALHDLKCIQKWISRGGSPIGQNAHERRVMTWTRYGICYCHGNEVSVVDRVPIERCAHPRIRESIICLRVTDSAHQIPTRNPSTICDQVHFNAPPHGCGLRRVGKLMLEKLPVSTISPLHAYHPYAAHCVYPDGYGKKRRFQ